MNVSTARQMVQAIDRVARRLELLREEAWVRDREARFLYVNGPFARFFDASRSTLKGRRDVDLFSGAEVRAFRRDDARCVAASAARFFPEDDPGGVAHQTLKLPLSLASGETVGVVGIAFSAPRRRPGSEAPRWLERVRSEVAEGFAGGVSIRRLAARAGVHPDHLARSFRHHYGEGVHALVRRLRIQWSCWALLERPGRRLDLLAVDAGFSDQSHFTREFRRVRGTTPGAFRDRCRDATLEAGGSSPVRLSAAGDAGAGRSRTRAR